MDIKKSGRPGGGTPRRPRTEGRSYGRDLLTPCLNHSTAFNSGQEKSFPMTPAEAKECGWAVIRSFMTPKNRRRRNRWPVYDAAMRSLRELHELTSADFEELNDAFSRYMRLV